jgi:ribonuclease P protein subunit POP4
MADKSNVKSIDPYKEFSAATVSILLFFINLNLTLNPVKGNRVVFKSSAPYIPQYATSNLSATSDPDALYANRVKGRQLLLENPVRKSEKKKEEERKRQQAQESRKRKKLGVIGKREAKEKGVWKLDKSQAEWVLY